MEKVRWGVLGCSDFARRRTVPAMLEASRVEPFGIASRTRDKAESFRRQFGFRRAYGDYQALLDDPAIDAVYIPLPNGLHAEWMIRSAECGKHCLCEKPFTADEPAAKAVAEAFAGSGVLVMEALMWRLHGQHRRAREVIRQGSTGPVRLVRSSYSFHFTRRPDVRLDPGLAGGAVRDIGCYPISAARFYFDDEPAEVFARGERSPEFGVDFAMAGMLKFTAGHALIDCSFSLPYRADLEIVCEEGTVLFPKPWQPDVEAVLIVDGDPVSLPPENHYVTQFDYFSRCITESTSPEFGVDDAIRQMRVIDAVLRSMDTGVAQPAGGCESGQS